MKPTTIIHLLSGGLDSVTMLYDMHRDGQLVYCLLFDYGQPHVQELQFAKGHCRSLDVQWSKVEIPQLGGLTDESWVVPFRNPIMLSVAVNFAVRAGAETITIASNADDRAEFPDCRWEVMDVMNHAIKLSGYDVTIKTPYENKRKWQIVALARELGVRITETWSCYRGGAKPCMKCPACEKMIAALDDDGGMKTMRPL